jgi:hypothetical protein
MLKDLLSPICCFVMVWPQLDGVDDAKAFLAYHMRSEVGLSSRACTVFNSMHAASWATFVFVQLLWALA